MSEGEKDIDSVQYAIRLHPVAIAKINAVCPSRKQLGAPLLLLEERELTRRNPKGLSRGHYAVNDIPVFDYFVDTAKVSPSEGAEGLNLWLKDKPIPGAIHYYSTEQVGG